MATFTPALVLENQFNAEFSNQIYMIMGLGVFNGNAIPLDQESDFFFTTTYSFVDDLGIFKPAETLELTGSIGFFFTTTYNFIDDLGVFTPNTIRLIPFSVFDSAIADKPFLPHLIGFDFWGTPQIGARPLAVQFTSKIPSYGTLIEWDFGDGNTSALANPSHVFAESGIYEIKLTVQFFGINYVGFQKSHIIVEPFEAVPPLRHYKVRDTKFKNTFTVD